MTACVLRFWQKNFIDKGEMKMSETIKNCPFCGEEKDLQILNQGECVHFACHYNCPKEQERSFAQLARSWFVNCPDCGTCGPMFYVDGEFGCKTDDECKQEAIAA